MVLTFGVKMAIDNVDYDALLLDRETDLLAIRKSIQATVASASLSVMGRSITRTSLAQLQEQRLLLEAEIAGIKNIICGGRSQYSCVKSIRFRC